MCALAHASRSFTNPSDTYRVLWSLSVALLSLQQCLDQLADWHEPTPRTPRPTTAIKLSIQVVLAAVEA
jgi:hypothetical protein